MTAILFFFVLWNFCLHFPMNVKVDGDRVLIKSFLGETTERFARIIPNVDVDIKGNKATSSRT